MPLVLVGELAGGIVVVSAGRSPDDTRGGGVGTGGIQDERGAAASVRTTSLAPVPSDATTLARLVISPPPLTAFSSCNAGDGAGNIGVDDDDTIVYAPASSLLRDGDSAAADSVSRSGRRRTSGPLVRAGHSLDSLPKLPPTVGQPRATLHHGRRSAAEAIPEASVVDPRAAPAPLLSSSISLQPEGARDAERAGYRRGAGNRRGAGGRTVAWRTVAVPCATAVNRQSIGAPEGGSDEAQDGEEARSALRPGFP